MAAKSHLVAVAYRAFGAAEQDCQDKFNAGVLKTDAEGAACIEAGLRASNLEGSVRTLRRTVLAASTKASSRCQAAGQRLADVIEAEETAIHALAGDLQRLDAQLFDSDFTSAGEAARREAPLFDAALKACT